MLLTLHLLPLTTGNGGLPCSGEYNPQALLAAIRRQAPNLKVHLAVAAVAAAGCDFIIMQTG